MELTAEFKQKVRSAAMSAYEKHTGSDDVFAKMLGLNASVFSRFKNGETDRIISDSKYMEIARKFEVTLKDNNWRVVRTHVYEQLEDSLTFCKQFSKSMIFVDECDIGKTFCTKHILKSMKNAFYIDCSQFKTRQKFIRGLAKIVGVDNNGKFVDVKDNLKWALNNIVEPIVVLDEAGDLDYTAFLDIKELWNATENGCAWYMIGADGLQTKLDNGFKNKKVGFAEIISRFSDKIIKVVPTGKDDRTAFFSELIRNVAEHNASDKAKVPQLVRQCVTNGRKLRHLNTLIKMAE